MHPLIHFSNCDNGQGEDRRKPGFHSGFPGTQGLGLFSAAFPGTSTGKWASSKADITWRDPLIWNDGTMRSGVTCSATVLAPVTMFFRIGQSEMWCVGLSTRYYMISQTMLDFLRLFSMKSWKTKPNPCRAASIFSGLQSHPLHFLVKRIKPWISSSASGMSLNLVSWDPFKYDTESIEVLWTEKQSPKLGVSGHS